MTLFRRSLSFSNLPFFYGWVVLGIGSLGMLMSIPGQTVGVSVFTDHLIDALGLSRNGISIAYLIGTISSALLLSSAGRAYDRYGARVIGVAVSFLLGCVLLYLSVIDHVTDGIISLFPAPSPAVISGFSFAVICIGFFALRFLGQGTLTMASRNMVMKWFVRKRGIANAVLGITVSLGFSIAPRIMDSAISYFSWRGAWRVLAVVLLFFSFVAFLFYRDNPEKLGLKPDGNGSVKRKRAQHIEALPSRDFRLKEARRTFAFWVFNLTIALSALIVTAFTFHVVSIFQAAGLDRAIAVNVFLPASLIAVSSQFIGSWASDYIPLKYLAFLQLLGIVILGTGIILLDQTAGYVFAIIGMGITQGMMGIMSNLTWPRFFGLKYLGEVSGYAMGWSVAGSAVGPYLFSLSLDLMGSYFLGAALCLGIGLLGMLGVFFVKKPA